MRHFLGGGPMLSSEELTLVRSCFLFADIGKDELNSFWDDKSCFIGKFSKGETVFSAGEEKKLGILLSGKARAFCADDSRGSIKTFFAGDLFGAAGVFCKSGNEPFSKIKAISSCSVLFVTRKGVEKLLLLNPERALDYICFLSDRVAFLNRRIKAFTGGEAVARVARYLLDTADENMICKNINFSSLAKSLDISRASLYRAKNELTEIKAISADKKDVSILDPDALKNIC